MKMLNAGKIQRDGDKIVFSNWQIDCEGEPANLDIIKKSIYAHLEAHNE